LETPSKTTENLIIINYEQERFKIKF
jgi:hypothetical protein